jgi:hypothetical protein
MYGPLSTLSYRQTSVRVCRPPWLKVSTTYSTPRAYSCTTSRSLTMPSRFGRPIMAPNTSRQPRPPATRVTPSVLALLGGLTTRSRPASPVAASHAATSSASAAQTCRMIGSPAAATAAAMSPLCRRALASAGTLATSGVTRGASRSASSTPDSQPASTARGRSARSRASTGPGSPVQVMISPKSPGR